MPSVHHLTCGTTRKLAAWRNCVCRRPGLLACGLALGVVALFFIGPLLGGGQFYHSDTHALLHPLKELVAAELRSGRLPLWDPHSLCGYPVLASYVSAVFLPQNLLYLLLPFGHAFTLFIVSKHLLAVLFQFLFLRRIGLCHSAAACGGIVFALAGPLLSISDFHAFSFECFPLMLWAWWRVIDRSDGQKRWVDGPWAVAVLVFTLAFFHGDLQTMYAGGILAFLLPLVVKGPRASAFARNSLRFALLLVASALLGAVQLFPSVELLPESTRVSLSGEQQFLHSLAPAGVPGIFWPGSEAEPGDFIAYRYLGLSTLLCGVLGSVLAWLHSPPRRRLVLYFAITGLVALLLALGDNVPVLGPLSSVLPGLDLFRYPEKWLGLLAFAVSVLGALGISEIDRTGRRNLALAVALALTVDLFLAGRPFLEERLVSGEVYASTVLPRLEERSDRYSAHDRLLRLPTSGTFGGLRLDPPPPVTEDTEDTGNPAGTLKAVRGRAIAWNIQTLLGNNAYRAGVRRVSGLSSFAFRHSETLWMEAARRRRVGRLADLMAARWILTTPVDLRDLQGRPGLEGLLPAGSPAARWKTELGRLFLLERPDALPRALVVQELQVHRDDAALIEALFDTDVDPRRTVLTTAEEVPGSPPARGQQPVLPVEPGKTEVRFVEDGLTSVVLEITDHPGRGYLVLNDSHAPGWKARVNGRPVPVFRANHFARGVALPSGPCRVEFTYEPFSLKLGLLSTTLALLFLAIVPLRHLLPRRRAHQSLRSGELSSISRQ